MNLIVKVPRRKTDAPGGVWQAVCVEVCDLGMVVNPFDKKQQELIHKIEICWELDEINADSGQPYFCQKEYTFTLGERSTLRRDVESWLGRKLQAGEQFDLETLVGQNCS
jgi:hypothetical protein